MTDTERLSWVEENFMTIMPNDLDEWACELESTPTDVFNWHPTIREAIDAAIDAQDESNQRGN
jgi:hypothetical protein